MPSHSSKWQPCIYRVSATPYGVQGALSVLPLALFLLFIAFRGLRFCAPRSFWPVERHSRHRARPLAAPPLLRARRPDRHVRACRPDRRPMPGAHLARRPLRRMRRRRPLLPRLLRLARACGAPFAEVVAGLMPRWARSRWYTRRARSQARVLRATCSRAYRPIRNRCVVAGVTRPEFAS